MQASTKASLAEMHTVYGVLLSPSVQAVSVQLQVAGRVIQQCPTISHATITLIEVFRVNVNV